MAQDLLDEQEKSTKACMVTVSSWCEQADAEADKSKVWLQKELISVVEKLKESKVMPPILND